jgi:hypothetical protein
MDIGNSWGRIGYRFRNIWDENCVKCLPYITPSTDNAGKGIMLLMNNKMPTQRRKRDKLKNGVVRMDEGWSYLPKSSDEHTVKENAQ